MLLWTPGLISDCGLGFEVLWTPDLPSLALCLPCLEVCSVRQWSLLSSHWHTHLLPLTPSLQIHHALADMLSSVLSPLVRADQPHSCTHLPAPLLAEWYSLIFTMKTDVWSWMNKHAKHIQVGPGVGWGGKQAR